MVGERYWTTGICISPHYNGDNQPPLWGAELSFYDDGFMDNQSTQGYMEARYLDVDPVVIIKVLKADAERMGIYFKMNNLYVPGDGEGEKADYLPDGWRESLAKVAQECGLEWIYSQKQEE